MRINKANLLALCFLILYSFPVHAEKTSISQALEITRLLQKIDSAQAGHKTTEMMKIAEFQCDTPLKNIINLNKAVIAKKIAFSKNSPIVEKYNAELNELKNDKVKGLDKIKKDQQTDLDWLKKTYLKKKKIWISKNVKGKKINKAIWKIPGSSWRIYNSKVSIIKNRYSKKIKTLNENYKIKRNSIIKNRDRERISYVRTALKLLTQGFIREYDSDDFIDFRIHAILLSLILNRLAYEDFDVERLTEVQPDLIDFKKEEREKVVAIIKLFQPFSEEDSENYYTFARKIMQSILKDREDFIDDADKHDYKKFISSLIKIEDEEMALIKTYNFDFLDYLYEIKQDTADAGLDFTYHYKRVFLAIDMGNYKRAHNVLEKIKDKIDDSEDKDSLKAMEYILFSAYKADVLSLEGKYGDSAELNDKTYQYYIKMEDEYSKKSLESLHQFVGPISGYKMSPQSFIVKKYLNLYYELMQEINPLPHNKYRPFHIEYTNDSIEKIRDLAKKIDSMIESDAVQKWESSGYDKVFYRLRLVQSLIYLEIDPKHSAKISEDVMYKGQEKIYEMLEYYATLMNGYAKIKMNIFRQARVDFTKVNTILLGNRSFDDLNWVIGYGKAMVELEEYKYLTEVNKITRGVIRARNKSLSYLVGHLRLSLTALNRVKNPINLFRIRAYLPYYVTPERQINSLISVSKLYKQDKVLKTLNKLKEALKEHRERNVVARFFARKLKKAQFKVLVRNQASSSEDKLSGKITKYNTNITKYKWNPKVYEILKWKNYKTYWRVN